MNKARAAKKGILRLAETQKKGKESKMKFGKYGVAIVLVSIAFLSGCGQQKIGMLGFRLGEVVNLSSDNQKRIGVKSETKREDGLVEWLFESEKPFREFREGKLVIDTKTKRIVQIRAGRVFVNELDALGEYDSSIEVFKEKYQGKWSTHKTNGRRIGIYSCCEFDDKSSVDVNVVPYYDYSVVQLMMTDDYFENRKDSEIRKDMESLD